MFPKIGYFVFGARQVLVTYSLTPLVWTTLNALPDYAAQSTINAIIATIFSITIAQADIYVT